MKNSSKECHQFFGICTLGERGQAVIPAGARKKFNLKKGEKLFVFGFKDEMIGFVKIRFAQNIAKRFEQKLHSLNDIIRNFH